jgi:hypothetical protein
MAYLLGCGKFRFQSRWFAVAGATCLVTASLLVFGWWILSPSYIEIPIAVTPNKIGYFWWDIQYSSLYYADEPGVLYVSRKGGTAYQETQGWATQQEVVNYFDNWLTHHGWEQSEMYTAGDPAIPETEFLKYGKDYFVYTMVGDYGGFNDSVKGNRGRVCVAVWPIEDKEQTESCSVKGFHIVVASVKPSLMRLMFEAFND